jgi:hypothetical protein
VTGVHAIYVLIALAVMAMAFVAAIETGPEFGSKGLGNYAWATFWALAIWPIIAVALVVWVASEINAWRKR